MASCWKSVSRTCMYLSRGQRKSAPSYIIKVVYLIPPPYFSEFTSFDIFLFLLFFKKHWEWLQKKQINHSDFIISVLTLLYILIIILIIFFLNYGKSSPHDTANFHKPHDPFKFREQRCKMYMYFLCVCSESTGLLVFHSHRLNNT